MKRSNAVAGVWVLLLLLISSCSFKEPAKPEWNLNVELPLIGRRYTMVDLADELKNLKVDDVAGEVIVHFDEDFETFEIGDKLKISGASKSVNIPGSGTLRDSVTISADVVVVDTAAIRSGVVSLNVRNPGAQDVTVEFELVDIRSAGGVPLSQSVSVGAGGTTFTQFSLAGYLITPPIRNGENVIRFTGRISGAGAANPVEVDVNIGEMVFGFMSGIINHMEVDIDATEMELDIPDAVKDFEIQRADLRLAVDLGLNIPVWLALRIEGQDTHDGTHPIIEIVDSIAAGVGVDTLHIPNLAPLINAMPEKISISGSFTLGDGVARTRITSDHVIESEGFFEMPLTLTLPVVDTKADVDTLEMDEDLRDVFRDNLISAGFYAELQNGLPLGGTVRLYFSRIHSDSTIYDLDPDTPSADYAVFTVPMRAGALDGGSPALVSSATNSSIEIALNQGNLPLFHENETLFFGMKMETDQTGTMVRVRPSDYIHITAHVSAEVNTRIPEDDDEEGGAS